MYIHYIYTGRMYEFKIHTTINVLVMYGAPNVKIMVTNKMRVIFYYFMIRYNVCIQSNYDLQIIHVLFASHP